jgi:hypothetical protein
MADLIFVRDCLVHFSDEDVKTALRQICSSGCKYFLTTIFPDSKKNLPIETGEWRPLNLLIPPFNLPLPIEVFSEGCSENDGKYADKSLGLWHLDQLQDWLQNSAEKPFQKA